MSDNSITDGAMNNRHQGRGSNVIDGNYGVYQESSAWAHLV